MTSTTLTRDPVETRSIGSRLFPAANVKIRRDWYDVIRDARADAGVLDVGDDLIPFLDWLEGELDSGDSWERFSWADEGAAEMGYEDAQTYLDELFGSGTKLWGDGRSGGWLYAELSGVETWGDPSEWTCGFVHYDEDALYTETVCGWTEDRHRPVGEAVCYWCNKVGTDIRDGWLYCASDCSPTKVIFAGDPHDFTLDEDQAETYEKWVKFADWANKRAQDCADEAVMIVYLNVWENRTHVTPQWNPPVNRAGYYS